MKNKAFLLIFMALFFLTTSAVSVFADDDDSNEPREYTYEVTVTYRLGPPSTNGWDMFETKEFTVTASSASEAESKAESRWENTKERSYWVFVSADAVRN